MLLHYLSSDDSSLRYLRYNPQVDALSNAIRAPESGAGLPGRGKMPFAMHLKYLGEENSFRSGMLAPVSIEWRSHSDNLRPDSSAGAPNFSRLQDGVKSSQPEGSS